MGGNKPLSVKLSELRPGAEHASGKRGKSFGQQEHSAVRKRRHAPGGRPHEEVRGKLRICPLRRRIAPYRKVRRALTWPAAPGQPRGKVPFAAHFVREEQPLFFQREIGVAGKETGDLLLVLPLLERTGGVHERSAARKHLCGVVQDRALARHAPLHIFGAPFADRRGLLAEHTLARTGRIDQDPVKPGGKPVRKHTGARADDRTVFHPQALDVLRKDPRPVIDIFIGDQNALPAHGRGELRGLSARRGAQIEHPFPRPRPEHGRGAHGGRLLHIEEPRVMRRGVSGPLLVRIKAVFLPRDGLPRKGHEGAEAVRRQFQHVGAHPFHGRFAVTMQKGRVRRAQPFAHSFQKFFGKIHTFSSALSSRSSGTNAAPAPIAFW